MDCGQQSQKNASRGRNAVDQLILTCGRTNECYSKISEPRPLTPIRESWKKNPKTGN